MKPSDLRKIIGEEVNQLVDRMTEGKGQDLADKYIAKLRSEFRKLNDDELDEFRETIAKALDLKESVNEEPESDCEPDEEKDVNIYEYIGSWTSTLDDLIAFGFGNLAVKFKGRDLGKVKDFKKLGSTVGPSITIRTFNYLLKKGGLKHDHKRNRAELGSKSSKYTKGSVELTEGEVTEGLDFITQRNVFQSFFDEQFKLLKIAIKNKDEKKFKWVLQATIDGIKNLRKKYIGESVNEASRRNVHKAAKKGSYPAVIVVVQDGKVIHQEPVSTPDIAPATFNVMQEKYPKAILHLEDNTGKRLFSESVNEVSTISKKRAGAELKQKLKGKRSDGLGKYTATIYGMSGGKRVELKSLNDLNKYSEFEIDESVNEVATLGASKAMRIGRKLGWDVKKRASGRTDYVTFTKDGKKYGPVDANAMTQTLLMKKLTESKVNEAEFKHISKDEHKIKLAIKDVEKKSRLKANRDKAPEYEQIALNKIMLSKVLGREKLSSKYKAAWDKLKKEYSLKESKTMKKNKPLNEAKKEPIVALLKQGVNARFGMGMHKLNQLADAFEDIGDEQAAAIVNHLNSAIELMQNGYGKSAGPNLIRFNKACKDALKLMKKQGLAEAVSDLLLSELSTKDILKHLMKARGIAASKSQHGLVTSLSKHIKDVRKQMEKEKNESISENFNIGRQSTSERDRFMKYMFKHGEAKGNYKGDSVTISTNGAKKDPRKWTVEFTKTGKSMKFIDTIDKLVVNEAELTEIRKGDYVGSGTEVGLVNKVTGSGDRAVAYVKFDSRPKSFHPILARNLTKTGKKHKGKDLYEEGIVNEAVKPIKLSGNLKKDLDNVTHMATKMVKYAKDNFNTYIPTGEKLSQLTIAGYKEKDVLKYNIRHLAKAINTDLKKKYMKDFMGESVTEAKFDKKKLMKAMKKDDGMITVDRGRQFIIYNPKNGNDYNTDMWQDKVIFAVDQDGEEHEIKYSDIEAYNEGKVNERFKHNDMYALLDIAAQYSSTQHQAANQMWYDEQELYDYLKSDHIPKKYHKDFYNNVKSRFKGVKE